MVSTLFIAKEIELDVDLEPELWSKKVNLLLLPRDEVIVIINSDGF